MNQDEDRIALVWRIAIVLIGVVLIWRGIALLAPASGPAPADRAGHALRAILATAIGVPFILLARRYLDRRPRRTLGLTSPRIALRQFLLGVLIWCGAAGLGLLLALASGIEISIGGPTNRELMLLAIGLPFLVFLYEALPEELIFRGYFFTNLAARYPRWLAVIGQAALFVLWGAAIGAAGSIDRLIVFFTFSVVLGVLRALTGAIWMGVGFHVAFQWVAQWLVVATADGVVRASDLETLQFIVFWLCPIVVLSIVLVLWSIWKKRVAWRATVPDPPTGAHGESSEIGTSR